MNESFGPPGDDGPGPDPRHGNLPRDESARPDAQSPGATPTTAPGRRSGRGSWAIAGGVALVVAGIVVIVVLVANGGSSNTRSTPTNSVSIGKTTSIVKPTTTATTTAETKTTSSTPKSATSTTPSAVGPIRSQS